MPTKKEESHDCKAECAELHKMLEALKKELSALKKELKAKPSGGSDPRVDKLIEYRKLEHIAGPESKAKRKQILKSL